VTKQKTTLWFGFLEAGERSSPVARDPSLDTGNPATTYIFNLMRGQILEYRKDIVELKLRELTTTEHSLVQQLQNAYQQAREGFTPRATKRGQRLARQGKKYEEPEDEELDPDDAWPMIEDEEFAALPTEQAE